MLNNLLLGAEIQMTGENKEAEKGGMRGGRTAAAVFRLVLLLPAFVTTQTSLE